MARNLEVLHDLTEEQVVDIERVFDKAFELLFNFVALIGEGFDDSDSMEHRAGVIADRLYFEAVEEFFQKLRRYAKEGAAIREQGPARHEAFPPGLYDTIHNALSLMLVDAELVNGAFKMSEYTRLDQLNCQLKFRIEPQVCEYSEATSEVFVATPSSRKH